MTVQVPTPVPVRVLPVTAQNVLPAVTAKLTVPVPEPPVVLSALVALKAMLGGVAIAVSVACVEATTSTAPTSQAAARGRAMPRWSVGCEHGAAPAASTAALPDCGIITSIIPPVSVAGNAPKDNVPLTALLAEKPVATPMAL